MDIDGGNDSLSGLIDEPTAYRSEFGHGFDCLKIIANDATNTVPAPTARARDMDTLTPPPETTPKDPVPQKTKAGTTSSRPDDMGPQPLKIIIQILRLAAVP